ncbi:hypothetical protein D8S78_24555 [Natrialba swarupiae]|nr:hypothetical protein [Natrialba swarupiae]
MFARCSNPNRFDRNWNPRPLADIAEVLDERPKSIRQKFHRLIQETTVSDTLDASDLVVDPPEYVPYLARQLGREDDAKLREQVRELLDETPQTADRIQCRKSRLRSMWR